jgi:hypothetical protein
VNRRDTERSRDRINKNCDWIVSAEPSVRKIESDRKRVVLVFLGVLGGLGGSIMVLDSPGVLAVQRLILP